MPVDKKNVEDSRVHPVTTVCGREALIKLSGECYQRLVTAATAAASGGGLWMIVPPTPGSEVMLPQGEKAEAQYFVVSPCLNLSVVGRGNSWSTIPTTIYRGGYGEQDSEDDLPE